MSQCPQCSSRISVMSLKYHKHEVTLNPLLTITVAILDSAYLPVLKNDHRITAGLMTGIK